MSVLSSEVNVLCLLKWLAEEGMTSTLSEEINLDVGAVVDDDVQLVLELLYLVRLTNDIDNLLFIRFQNAVSLNDFPN